MQHPIVNAIVARRIAAKITQEQAARMAKMSLRTYQRVESGLSDMKLRNYQALIEGLELTHLDICLDVLGYDVCTNWDVAAAAALLPEKARATLVQLIMMIDRHYTKQGKGTGRKG